MSWANEEVHKKVIRGELWEKEPNKVPVCVDCHEPHEARKIFYEEGIADSECLECHSNPNLTAVRENETISLFVDSIETHSSMHRSVACAQCHTGANPSNHRSCATIAIKVDCSICHTEIVDTYNNSMHGTLYDRGDQRAPECTTCHGTHGVKSRKDPKSITFPMQVPELCGQCHGANGQANGKHPYEKIDAVTSYLNGIHGKGLKESGLIVAAKCTDCHTTHNILPRDDPNSSVHESNIPKTCANCHEGIFEEFAESIHCSITNPTDLPLPRCIDCHSSHTVYQTSTEPRPDMRISASSL